MRRAFDALHFIDEQNAVVNHRRGKQHAVEAVQNAAMPRNQIAVVLDAHLAFERRRSQIAKLRKENKIAEGAIKRIQRTRESNRIDQENQYTNNKNRRRNRSRQR